eukprot:Gb_30632 [translate_table: standard]
MHRKRLLLTVPKRIHKDLIVFYCNWAYSASKFKSPLFKHHCILIVHASALREYKKRVVVRTFYMLLYLFSHNYTIFGFCTIEPYTTHALQNSTL